MVWLVCTWSRSRYDSPPTNASLHRGLARTASSRSAEETPFHCNHWRSLAIHWYMHLCCFVFNNKKYLYIFFFQTFGLSTTSSIPSWPPPTRLVPLLLIHRENARSPSLFQCRRIIKVCIEAEGCEAAIKSQCIDAHAPLCVAFERKDVIRPPIRCAQSKARSLVWIVFDICKIGFLLYLSWLCSPPPPPFLFLIPMCSMTSGSFSAYALNFNSSSCFFFMRSSNVFNLAVRASYSLLLFNPYHFYHWIVQIPLVQSLLARYPTFKMRWWIFVSTLMCLSLPSRVAPLPFSQHPLPCLDPLRAHGADLNEVNAMMKQVEIATPFARLLKETTKSTFQHQSSLVEPYRELEMNNASDCTMLSATSWAVISFTDCKTLRAWDSINKFHAYQFLSAFAQEVRAVSS